MFKNYKHIVLSKLLVPFFFFQNLRDKSISYQKKKKERERDKSINMDQKKITSKLMLLPLFACMIEHRSVDSKF